MTAVPRGSMRVATASPIAVLRGGSDRPTCSWECGSWNTGRSFRWYWYCRPGRREAGARTWKPNYTFEGRHSDPSAHQECGQRCFKGKNRPKRHEERKKAEKTDTSAVNWTRQMLTATSRPNEKKNGSLDAESYHENVATGGAPSQPLGGSAASASCLNGNAGNQ